jgi:hypothetical protein
MFESRADAAQDCFRGDNPPETIGIRVDSIIH